MLYLSVDLAERGLEVETGSLRAPLPSLPPSPAKDRRQPLQEIS